MYNYFYTVKAKIRFVYETLHIPENEKLNLLCNAYQFEYKLTTKKTEMICHNVKYFISSLETGLFISKVVKEPLMTHVTNT